MGGKVTDLEKLPGALIGGNVVAMTSIADVIARLEASGIGAASVPDDVLDALPWLARVPADYVAFVRRFGGRDVDAFSWRLPALSRRDQLQQSFDEGGAPAHLIAFAEQDGTWFMAFDESAGGKVVEWDHETQKAKRFKGSFTAWLAKQLDETAAADAEERDVLAAQQQQGSAHVPFCDTSLGKAAALRLGTEAGQALRDVLLDLHLQYTFHPHVIAVGEVRYLGLLHFTDSSIGCWRCGRMNAKTLAACAGCGEALLLRTFGEGVRLPTRTTSAAPCFGVWAAAHVDVASPRPALVTTPYDPRGIPKWARLTAFGGSRDPRVASQAGF
jgi:hypothetical protein